MEHFRCDGWNPLCGTIAFMAGSFTGTVLDRSGTTVILKADPFKVPSMGTKLFIASIETALSVLLFKFVDHEKFALSDENSALFMMGHLMNLRAVQFAMRALTGEVTHVVKKDI